MSQYYLMAQLPSLDAIADNAPLPITEERFFELCNRFLGKKAAAVLNALTLMPKTGDAPTGVAIVDAWYRAERELRCTLAVLRAKKMQKAPQQGALETISTQVMQVAKTAVDMTDPMEAELYLIGYRLAFLETLRPFDAFSLASVYYYGLKLKLLSRIKQFDVARGEAEYKHIYHSIMHGEEQETKG